METRYLMHVLAYIEQAITAEELLRLYDEAIAALRTSLQTSPPTIPLAVHRPLAALLEAHQRIEPHGWSPTEMAVYANMRAVEVLGAAACIQLEAISHRQRTDPEAAAADVQQLRDATEHLMSEVMRLRTGLAAALAGAPESPAVEILPAGWLPRTALQQPVRALSRWTQSPAALRDWLARPQTAAVVAVATPVVVTLASLAARSLAAYRRAASVATPVRPTNTLTVTTQPAPTVHIFNQTTIISLRER